MAQSRCIWFDLVVRLAQCSLSFGGTGPLQEAIVSSLRIRPSMKVVVNFPPPRLMNTANVAAPTTSGCHRLAKPSMGQSPVGPCAVISTAPMGRLILMLHPNQELGLPSVCLQHLAHGRLHQENAPVHVSATSTGPAEHASFQRLDRYGGWGDGIQHPRWHPPCRPSTSTR